ncbi:MAG: hypothetical protein E6J89_15175 [Deltaproteobacteria bacterium]|nr:MAG: hypothetical protein E6J89_15175 [Deltaproteobacteria bacterium]
MEVAFLGILARQHHLRRPGGPAVGGFRHDEAAVARDLNADGIPYVAVKEEHLRELARHVTRQPLHFSLHAAAEDDLPSAPPVTGAEDLVAAGVEADLRRNELVVGAVLAHSSDGHPALAVCGAQQLVVAARSALHCEAGPGVEEAQVTIRAVARLGISELHLPSGAAVLRVENHAAVQRVFAASYPAFVGAHKVHGHQLEVFLYVHRLPDRLELRLGARRFSGRLARRRLLRPLLAKDTGMRRPLAVKRIATREKRD